MSKKRLYLKVSDDIYELPVAVADSAPQLAKMIGLSEQNIWNCMRHAKKTGKESVYKVVMLEEKDGNEMS